MIKQTINSYSLLRTISSFLVILVFALVACVTTLPIKNETETQAAIQDNDSTLFLGLYNMFGGGNPSSTPNGDRLIEGDIVLPSSIIAPGGAMETGSQLSERKAVPDSGLYWPNGEVIYSYHESIKPNEMTVIEAAMRHWSQHTCIKFRPRQTNDLAFVRFRSDTQGCWSLVGRQINSPNGYGHGQDVSIGLGCANLNVVVHEIGHVIGFYHEQSRSDRDKFIEIVWANVLPGYALQFRKESDSNFDIPYDLTSTMQYPQWAFSKEIFEKSTIVAKNPAYQRFLSKNYPLSFRDRLIANQMYQCSRSCSSRTGSCQNGGYMRAVASADTYGAQCSCDCPPNYTGASCETQLRSDYYDELPCGGIVDREGSIETPGYPQRTAPGQSCMWDIHAPAGHRISIKFNGFGFAPRFTKPGTKVINKCFNETVEVRLRSSSIYDGDTYCGNDIAPNTVMRSDGPRAVIVITANDKMIGQGLSARVKFFREGTTPNEDSDDDNDDQETGQPETPQPIKDPAKPPTSTGLPLIFSTPSVITLPPPGIVPQTLPPQPPPPPPPPPSLSTPSDLWEEYEKESKKTLPPVIPIMREYR